ncbi:MAG TPA: DUF2442 domain-containing protein [Longimicrobium sp.]|jgi:hypothetical protein
MNMFLHVDGVTHLNGYELRLEFNNGTVKDVDLAAELYGQVFEPLREPRFFGQVRVNPETGTIEWPNGADFAPEFLFDAGTTVHELA